MMCGALGLRTAGLHVGAAVQGQCVILGSTRIKRYKMWRPALGREACRLTFSQKNKKEEKEIKEGGKFLCHSIFFIGDRPD